MTAPHLSRLRKEAVRRSLSGCIVLHGCAYGVMESHHGDRATRVEELCFLPLLYSFIQFASLSGLLKRMSSVDAARSACLHVDLAERSTRHWLTGWLTDWSFNAASAVEKNSTM